MTKPLGPTDLKRLHRDWRRRTEQRLALLLDGVSTTFNIGSIVRTAAALGVEHIYVTDKTTPLDHPKAGRASKGTERYLQWSTHADGPACATAARAAGYEVVGIELAPDAEPLFAVRLAGAVCLAVGHEDHGLTQATLAACDRVAFIPQVGRVGSLNVATATSIALYEARRQHWGEPNLST